MKFRLEQAVEVLRNTPHVLRALLQNVSDAWARSNYGPDTFSPFDVVGHLILGEKTDWMPRLRIMLVQGESRPFEPFDRYAMFDADKDRTMAQLLDEFERRRRDNLAALGGLGLAEAQFSRKGTHPALGSVTVENLLATWVVHDLNHIAQIARAMAYQYKDAVGPWKEYLSILTNPADSTRETAAN